MINRYFLKINFVKRNNCAFKIKLELKIAKKIKNTYFVKKFKCFIK